MRCKHCKQKFIPKTFLQKFCMDQPECITAFLTEMKSKNSQKEKKDWSLKKKVMKEKLKTLTDYENEARKEFQKFIRLRDKNLPCISCGKHSDNYDAGHYFSANQFSGLIFHEWNVNAQCKMFCNNMMHGNLANYRIGLVLKIGEQNMKWLEDNKDRLRLYKYTKEELISIKEIYMLKQKEFKNLT